MEEGNKDRLEEANEKIRVIQGNSSKTIIEAKIRV
jgi:hypothetical protein